MYKEQISYVDYKGVQRTETLCFAMNKFELTQWQSQPGKFTMSDLINKLSEEMNSGEMLKIFESIIAKSYGKLSEDGREFRKSPEIYNSFKYSPAYSKFIMSLLEDGDKSAEKTARFIKGIMDPEQQKELEDIIKENPEELKGALADSGVDSDKIIEMYK